MNLVDTFEYSLTVGSKMIRFSMYSGEEIEMEDTPSSINKSGEVDEVLDFDSREGVSSNLDHKRYSSCYESLDKKRTIAVSTEGEVKQKSSDEDDETCMSSLALMDGSSEQINTSNTTKNDITFGHQSARNSACLTNASYGNFRMKRNEYSTSPDVQYQTDSCINSPLICQEQNLNNIKSSDPVRNVLTDQRYKESNWYSDPPPPLPPPFRQG